MAQISLINTTHRKSRDQSRGCLYHPFLLQNYKDCFSLVEDPSFPCIYAPTYLIVYMYADLESEIPILSFHAIKVKIELKRWTYVICRWRIYSWNFPWAWRNHLPWGWNWGREIHRKEQKTGKRNGAESHQKPSTLRIISIRIEVNHKSKNHSRRHANWQ